MTQWFARLAQPLDRDDQIAARAYLDALGYDQGLELRLASTISQVDAAIRAPDWDTAWWVAEESAREALRQQLDGQLGPSVLLQALSEQALRQDEGIHLAACGVFGTDTPLARAATGAGAMARHDYAMAALAQAPDTHVFMRKYRFFARGRWPLGVIRNVFHLY